MRGAGLLAALAIIAAPVAAGEPATQGRIWQGTLGERAITACFPDDFAYDGVYYIDAALEPIRLAQVEGADPPEVAEVGGEGATGATWRLQSGEGGIAGERTTETETLPIRLTATPVQLPQYGSACETAAFLAPLLAGGTVTSRRESLDGTAYTVLAYTGAQRAGLEDYQIQTFVITPAAIEDEAINAMLSAALPDDSAGTFMGECYGMGLASGAPGSYIDETQVPVLISPRWVGVRQSGSSYCGGAHPNHFSTMAVYDRNIGAQADPARWFKPGALLFYEFAPEPGQLRPVAGLSSGLLKAIAARWPNNAENTECADMVGNGDSWSIGLTREGPVFVLQLPHVAFACTEEIVLPWRAARPFLSPEGRAVMASLR